MHIKAELSGFVERKSEPILPSFSQILLTTAEPPQSELCRKPSVCAAKSRPAADARFEIPDDYCTDLDFGVVKRRQYKPLIDTDV